MEVGHIPVLAEEVMSMLGPPREASRSMPRSAAVGTPSGSWRRPTLMAASSVSMPMGRPSPECDGRLRPRFGDRLVLRQANFRELAEVAPEAGFDAVDGSLFDLGLSSYQLADTDAASASAPAVRSTCASTSAAASRRRSSSRRSMPMS